MVNHLQAQTEKDRLFVGGHLTKSQQGICKLSVPEVLPAPRDVLCKQSLLAVWASIGCIFHELGSSGCKTMNMKQSTTMLRSRRIDDCISQVATCWSAGEGQQVLAEHNALVPGTWVSEPASECQHRRTEVGTDGKIPDEAVSEDRPSVARDTSTTKIDITTKSESLSV